MRLYVGGKTIIDVSATMGIEQATLKGWRDKYRWEDIKNDINARMAKRMVDEATQIRESMVSSISQIIHDITEDIKLSKNPTKDKLYQVLQKYQEMYLQLQGITVDEKVIKHEHNGEVKVKLEDYFK